MDLTTGEITPSDPNNPTPAGPAVVPGLFSSQNWTANTTTVYQPGHMVDASRPEAAYYIFDRVTMNKDIATGTISASDKYSTHGLWNSTTTLDPGPTPSPSCCLRAMPATCAQNQIDAAKNGTATVVEGLVTDPKFPEGICPSLPGPYF